MQDSKVTMKVIADELGITKVSVSKAINNQPGVSLELKKRILDKAVELGYAGVARKSEVLPKRLEFVISKRFFLEDDKFYTVIYYTLSKLCNDKSIRLSLSVVGTTDEARITLPPSLTADSSDGIFLAGELSLPYAKALVQTGIPVVSIDFCHPELLADSIVNDNFYAAYNATMYLIAKGHREIGFVGNPLFTASVMDRHLGYLKAMRTMGLPVEDSWMVVNNDLQGGYAVSCSLPDPLPTAFLCHCDMAAHYMMIKLLADGVAVPEQVSLLSFDNTELSRTISPQLSTVDIDKKRMAQTAFARMLARIEDTTCPPARIVMDAQLLERESVLPIL